MLMVPCPLSSIIPCHSVIQVGTFKGICQKYRLLRGQNLMLICRDLFAVSLFQRTQSGGRRVFLRQGEVSMHNGFPHKQKITTRAEVFVFKLPLWETLCWIDANALTIEFWDASEATDFSHASPQDPYSPRSLVPTLLPPLLCPVKFSPSVSAPDTLGNSTKVLTIGNMRGIALKDTQWNKRENARTCLFHNHRFSFPTHCWRWGQLKANLSQLVPQIQSM